VGRDEQTKTVQETLAACGNVRFGDMVTLAEAFGFHLSRTNGSHHIFVHPHVPELLNLQNFKGKAKPYQVRQFVTLVEEYNLDLGD
jgi:hypothetical protein